MVLTNEQIITFVLVFIRLTLMLMLAPVFSGKTILSMGKVAFAFWCSSLLIFYIPLPISFPLTPLSLLVACLIEAIVGAMLGFLTQIFVIGLEFAGGLMDTQAGLSVASVLDPSSGQTTTLISKILKQLALLIFLLINGHHILLASVIQSFTLLPIGSPFQLEKGLLFVVQNGGLIFQLAVQFAAPILLIIFLTDFGFGMLSRVAPQVNVFQLGFQLKPLVSMLILLTIVPGMVDLIYYILETIASKLLQTLYLLSV